MTWPGFTSRTISTECDDVGRVGNSLVVLVEEVSGLDQFASSAFASTDGVALTFFRSLKTFRLRFLRMRSKYKIINVARNDKIFSV